jgi:glycosidase
MKKIFAAFIITLFFLASNAQLITTDPPLPVVTEAVTVTFNAALGSGGLAGYTGDVYAHTGVITQYSSGGSDWKYVKTDWGQNIPETKLTRIGTDLYTLEITSTIRSYYGVPAGEEIFQMAFVFRSGEQVGGVWLEGKTETGGDIFVDVYEAGLQVSFNQPQQFPVILELNETFITEINASEADSVFLYVDDILVNKVAGNYLLDTIEGLDYGKYKVKCFAENQTGMAVDSFYYHVRTEVTIQELPSGIRDGINYTGSQSVVLCLLAPGKEYVYVIGDFNDWDIAADHYMNRTPDGKRFWVEINNLIPGKEYVFQYFINGNIKVGDPYADKTSDPWNDSYISEATYPNLVDYPAGKTTGIATVLQTNQAPFVWEVEDFTPAPVTDLVIYETLVRDFTTEHTYEAIVGKLDYLQGIGINALELMPVNEFEGNLSWGYNPSFYFAPDKYYGPKDELKNLVDECHKRGIAVIIDLVLNHSYDQSPLVQMYFDGSKPTLDNPWYNVDHNFANPDAQWGNDFDHESPYTQAFVDSVNSYWMSEYKIDGFRFDFTKGFSNTYHNTSDPWGSNYDAARVSILKRMSDQIWERNPDAIVIFEHLAVNDEEKVLADYGILLWGNLNYNYGEAAMSYINNSDFSWISYKKRNWNDPHVVGYMESHDEERLTYKCINYGSSEGDYNIKDTTIALRRMALNNLFFLTIPGPKMIWQFGELGYDYSIEYNGRLGEKPVRWDYLNDYRRRYLSDFTGALIKLRTEQPAFETADFNLSLIGAMKKITLTHSSMNAMILGNFDVQQTSYIPGFAHTGTWYDYFTGQPFEVTDLAESMSFEAGEYRLFTDVQLPTPQISTIIDEPETGNLFLRVYPNPSDEFTVEINLESSSSVELSVYDITGNLVDNVFVGKLPSGSHLFRWSGTEAGLAQGVYFIRMVTDQESIAAKVLAR